MRRGEGRRPVPLLPRATAAGVAVLAAGRGQRHRRNGPANDSRIAFGAAYCGRHRGTVVLLLLLVWAVLLKLLLVVLLRWGPHASEQCSVARNGGR